jgi:hypothetical protein
MDDSPSSENPILNLLNEDNYTIHYYPESERLHKRYASRRVNGEWGVNDGGS